MFKQKKASKNFDINDLPSNRKEVFFDRIKNQYNVLFKLGLLLLAFSLPLIIASFFNDYTVWYRSSQSQLTDTEYFKIKLIFSLIEIPAYLILSIGLAGSFRVIKNLAWDIPVFFKEDFKDGIKKNFKQFLIIFFFFAVIKGLCYFTMSDTAVPALVRFLPSGIFIGIVIPICLISMNLCNLYNPRFLESCKLSLRFFFGKFFKSLGFSLLVLCPLGFLLIPNFIIKDLVLLFSAVFLMPLSIFIWFLFTCYLFDNFMNQKNYPEIYDKGIHRKEGNTCQK